YPREIPMRMALRRAGRALAVAGTLGFVASATAQNLTGSPAQAAPVSAASAVEVGVREGGPGQPARLSEIQVELGWMADPFTFPYRLEAKANGGALEVRGVVPSEAVRQRALRIAREGCPLKVTDGLKVYPRWNLPGTGVPPRGVES